MAIVYGTNYNAPVPSLDLRFASAKTLRDQASGKDLVTFTRASSGTYVGSDGLVKSAAANEPRFDHDPTTGESLGLLVEEARTNLNTYSEQFDNVDWNKQNGFSITSNQATAPDGTFTADAASRTNESTQFLYKNFTISGTLTFSCWLKVASGSYNFSMAVNAADGSKNSPTFTATTAWTRFSFTVTQTSAVTAFYPCIIPANVIFYVWGAQLEAGSFPTSYIPTVASTVTRSADVASITGTNFSSWYRQDEGTILITQRNNTANLTGTIVEIGGTTGNYAYGHTAHNIGFANATTLDIRSYLSGGGTPSGFFYGTRTSPGTISYAYKQSNYGLSTGGNNVPINGGPWNQLVPVVDSYLGLGRIRSGASAAQLHIARLAYYPVRLPDATLQSLTLTR